MSRTPHAILVAAIAAGGAAIAAAPPAHADVVAYLVNVTVRPGYNFASADDALRHGNAICDQIAAGVAYSQIVNDVRADFDTADEFQASYLITQAANELCPVLIWRLRTSAAHYRPSAT